MNEMVLLNGDSPGARRHNDGVIYAVSAQILYKARGGLGGPDPIFIDGVMTAIDECDVVIVMDGATESVEVHELAFVAPGGSNE